MARAVRDGAKTSVAIREAAADLFFSRGYEATSLREVAAAVGVQVGSLYNHIKGKDELLNDIMTGVMSELNAAMDEALGAAGPSALEQFKAGIGCHIRYHAEHAREVFIGNSELRSLNADDHKVMSAERHNYENRMRGLIERLMTDTGTDVLNLQLQTYAVLAVGVHLSTWYRPDGPLDLDEIVDVYTRIALRQFRIERPAAQRRPTRKVS